MFLFLKLERGHFCNHYLIADNIFFCQTKIIDFIFKITWCSCVWSWSVVASLSHLSPLFQSRQNFMCRNILLILFYRPHDVLAFEAGAWSSLSSLLHGRNNFTCRNIVLISIYWSLDVLASVAGAWSTLSPLLHNRRKFICWKNIWFYFFRPHDVLASEAGAWSPFSPLLQSRQNFVCRNI